MILHEGLKDLKGTQRYLNEVSLQSDGVLSKFADFSLGLNPKGPSAETPTERGLLLSPCKPSRDCLS